MSVKKIENNQIIYTRLIEPKKEIFNESIEEFEGSGYLSLLFPDTPEKGCVENSISKDSIEIGNPLNVTCFVGDERDKPGNKGDAPKEEDEDKFEDLEGFNYLNDVTNPVHPDYYHPSGGAESLQDRNHRIAQNDLSKELEDFLKRSEVEDTNRVRINPRERVNVGDNTLNDDKPFDDRFDPVNWIEGGNSLVKDMFSYIKRVLKNSFPEGKINENNLPFGIGNKELVKDIERNDIFKGGLNKETNIPYNLISELHSWLLGTAEQGAAENISIILNYLIGEGFAKYFCLFAMHVLPLLRNCLEIISYNIRNLTLTSISGIFHIAFCSYPNIYNIYRKRGTYLKLMIERYESSKRLSRKIIASHTKDVEEAVTSSNNDLDLSRSQLSLNVIRDSIIRIISSIRSRISNLISSPTYLMVGAVVFVIGKDMVIEIIKHKSSFTSTETLKGQIIRNKEGLKGLNDSLSSLLNTLCIEISNWLDSIHGDTLNRIKNYYHNNSRNNGGNSGGGNSGGGNSGDGKSSGGTKK